MGLAYSKRWSGASVGTAVSVSSRSAGQWAFGWVNMTSKLSSGGLLSPERWLSSWRTVTPFETHGTSR